MIETDLVYSSSLYISNIPARNVGSSGREHDEKDALFGRSGSAAATVTIDVCP